MGNKLFSSKEEAIEWVRTNIPFAIKPTRKTKAKLVYSFSSVNAHKKVVEDLGKNLWEYQNSIRL